MIKDETSKSETASFPSNADDEAFQLMRVDNLEVCGSSSNTHKLITFDNISTRLDGFGYIAEAAWTVYVVPGDVVSLELKMLCTEIPPDFSLKTWWNNGTNRNMDGKPSIYHVSYEVVERNGLNWFKVLIIGPVGDFFVGFKRVKH